MLNPVQISPLGERLTILFFEPHSLSSECVADALRRALPDFDLTQIVTPDDVDLHTNHDVGLVILGDSVAKNVEQLQGHIRLINGNYPAIPIAILGSSTVNYSVEWLAAHEIKGIFPDVISAGTTMAGIRFILEGGEYFPRNNNRLAGRHVAESGQNSIEHSLSTAFTVEHNIIGLSQSHDGDIFTRKEAAVLTCLAAGQPNKVIAKQLAIAENTVKIHVRSIFKKLRASNRTEAVLAAHRLNLLNLS
jgi:DNA-binding NarL/FixJ family response regulator